MNIPADKYPRCLMVATGSILRETGYSIRVWFSLRAISTVQEQRGEPHILLSFESLRDLLRRKMRRHIRSRSRELNVRVICCPAIPKKLPGHTWLNKIWASWIIKLILHRGKINIIHGQSHYASGICAHVIRKKDNVQLVFDAHGVDLEEALADGRLKPNSAAYRLRLRMLKEAIGRANWLLPVSTSLIKHLDQDGFVTGEIQVVPCVSSLPVPSTIDLEDERQHAREALDVSDRTVVLYLGGASSWQQPRFMLECFQKIRKVLSDAFFLVLTGNPKFFLQLLRREGLPEQCYCVKSVPHDQVYSWAAAADIGLLMRKKNIINEVASPTKYAEYLSLGIPVALTDVLDDFARLTHQENVGVVMPASISPGKAAQCITSFLAENGESNSIQLRDRCKVVAKTHLSFRSSLQVYRKIYGPQSSSEINLRENNSISENIDSQA